MIMYNKKPIISVIIPTFNRTHLLEKSVQGVLQQTFTDFELIIVDDDSRIKYIKCVENKGVHTARNIGIKTVKDNYIAFQGSKHE